MNIEKFWATYDRIQITDWVSREELRNLYASKEELDNAKNTRHLIKREVYGIRLGADEVLVLGTSNRLAK